MRSSLKINMRAVGSPLVILVALYTPQSGGRSILRAALVCLEFLQGKHVQDGQRLATIKHVKLQFPRLEFETLCPSFLSVGAWTSKRHARLATNARQARC